VMFISFDGDCSNFSVLLEKCLSIFFYNSFVKYLCQSVISAQLVTHRKSIIGNMMFAGADKMYFKLKNQ